MKKKYCKIMVSNIVSDEIVELTKGVCAHMVICDCTVEGSKFTEKGVCRIFSHEEYDDVAKQSFYYIESLTNKM